MKEIIFKHQNRIDSNKKDIFLKEVFEKDGTIAKTERRCFYFIKEIRQLGEGKYLENWIKSQHNDEPKLKRHFHIFYSNTSSIWDTTCYL